MTDTPGLGRGLGARVGELTATRARSALVLSIALLIAVACAVFGSRIPVDTDLKSLLPPDAPSVAALDLLRERKGSTEVFTLAVEERDPVARQQMVDGLAQSMGTWPETLYLYEDQDYTVIRDHALYLLEVDELEKLRDTFVRERKRAIARSMARGVGFDGDVDVDAVSVGDEDWDDPLEDEEPPPAPEPAPEAAGGDEDIDVREWLRERKAALAATGKLSADEIELIWPAENEQGELVWRDQVRKPYLNDAGDVQVVKATLSEPPTNVEFAQSLADRIAVRVAELKAQGIAPDARVEIVAAYNVTKDVDVVIRDATRATSLSLVLVVCVLVVGLKSARAVAIVVLPLLIAAGMTLGVARLLVPGLNALTVFMFAVLFGMGVDFAVHLFAQRHDGRARAWSDVIAEHLRPLGASMLTTVGSLLVLEIAGFKAFREFGLISAAGVLICFGCAVLLVPALDRLLPAFRPRVHASVLPAGAEPTRLGPLRWLTLAAVVSITTIGAPKVGFEKDLRETTVQPRGAERIAYSSATGRCSKYLTLVAEDAASLDAAVARVAQERDERRLLPGGPDLPGRDPKPWIRGVYSVATVMPTDQDAKREILGAIAVQANDFLAELPELDAEARSHRTHLEALEKLAKAPPLQETELPDWALEPFVEKSGRHDRLAHVCLDIRNSHLDELVAVKARFDQLLAGDALAADTRLVLADLVSDVQADSRRLPLVALVVLLLFIAADLRGVRATVAVFGALLLGLGLVLALMGLIPIHTNFFNLVVLPAVLGTSPDAGIHLWHSRRRSSYAATGRAVIVSALTTMAGFAGLLVAEHPGMRSIGELGVCGIGACVGVIFLALYPARGRRAASDAQSR